MSSDRGNLFGKGEEFLSLFTRGAEFTKELLRENERLRARVMEVEDKQESAARNPEDWEKLRRELLLKIENLEQEYRSVRERLRQVEEENQQFAGRYIEIEEENNNLANLYVASYQLHSTLDLEEVLKIIIEIVINLVGAEVFAVYILDENTGETRGGRLGRRSDVRFPAVQARNGRHRQGAPVHGTDVLEDRSVGGSRATDRLHSAIGSEQSDRCDHDLQPPSAEGRILRARSRAVHRAGRARGDRALRGAAVLAVGEEVEHDSGLH